MNKKGTRWGYFSRWWVQDDWREIMMVHYFTETNMVECEDWCSKKIWKLTGALTPDLWQQIKLYCRTPKTPSHVPTRIYIWAGMNEKFLAYCEPIDNYLKDEKLLQTGQGFHYGSGRRYGEEEKKKCPTCGQIIN